VSFLAAAAFGAHAAAAPAPAAAPEAVAAQLRDAALAGHDIAYQWVSELTSRFGPRPAGSVNEQQAAEWAAARFKELGFENVHIESFPVTAWVRGAESAQITSPLAQPLVAAALGESPPTPAAGVEGEVVTFASLDALKAAPPGSLSGKIAMVAGRMVRTQDGAGYGVAVDARVDGPGEAAQRGAIAFLLRSVGTDSHRLAHTGTTRYVDGRVPVPAFALSNPDADQIARLAALGEKVRVRLYSSASYVKDAHSQNVIADVRGRARPQEVVLLGAHLDSWDQGTGAVDDGTGMAIITAAAALIREAIPNFHMVIIGAGTDSNKVTAAAQKTQWIHYVGPKFGQQKASYFRLASLFLMPAAVGLSILDAFVAKLPFFTTDADGHGPEIQYIENSINGFITRQNSSTYANIVIKALQNPGFLRQLSEGAGRSADSYSIEKMVENVRTGIVRCLGLGDDA